MWGGGVGWRRGGGVRTGGRAVPDVVHTGVLLVGSPVPCITLLLWLVWLWPRQTHAAGGISVAIGMATLPVGAGLGSSAALSVATAAALVQVHALLTAGSGAGNVVDATAAPVVIGDFGTGVPPTAPARSIINDWAFCAETLFHGTPSGLDNTVSTCVDTPCDPPPPLAWDGHVDGREGGWVVS